MITFGCAATKFAKALAKGEPAQEMLDRNETCLAFEPEWMMLEELVNGINKRMVDATTWDAEAEYHERQLKRHLRRLVYIEERRKRNADVDSKVAEMLQALGITQENDK